MASNHIKAIDKASVARICSGQVILDLTTAVKELVENAMDAGATTVEVRLKEHGLQLIEVADNGRGVQPKDYEALALKYHTSKLSAFHDLENLHTFGFRGEALSSLAALSELSVITRTADQAAATRLDFDKHGKLVKTSPCARGVGTTVIVKDLFATLPVRRQDFQKNVRREVNKLKVLLQQYAILAGQAQLFASDQSGKSARMTLVSTSNAGPAVHDRVSAVLGAKIAALLQPLEFELASEGIKVTGLVSRAGCGVKGDKLRQFCCVNGRPVDLPRALKTVNEIYKSLYSSVVGLKPLAFLCFELPAGSFDVNVTPDKRSVFIQKEVAITTALGQALQALWEPSRYTYTIESAAAAPAAAPAATNARRSVGSAAAGSICKLDDDETVAAEEDAAEDTAADKGIEVHCDDGGLLMAGTRFAADQATGVTAGMAAAAAGSSGTAGDVSSCKGGVALPGAITASLLSFAAVGRNANQPGVAAATDAAAVSPDRADEQQQQQQHLVIGDYGVQERLGVQAVKSVANADNEQNLGVGVKRMRPARAALLGKLARTKHNSSSSTARAAAAAEDEEEEEDDDVNDEDDDDGEVASASTTDQMSEEEEEDLVGDAGSCAAAAAAAQQRSQLFVRQQQHHHQQQQQRRPWVSRSGGLENLAAFSLHAGAPGSVIQQQQRRQQEEGVRAAIDAEPSDQQHVSRAQAAEAAAAESDVSHGHRKQVSLAACGFKVAVMESSHRKQQQQYTDQGDDDDGGGSRDVADGPSEARQQAIVEQVDTAAAAAAAATAGCETLQEQRQQQGSQGMNVMAEDLTAAAEELANGRDVILIEGDDDDDADDNSDGKQVLEEQSQQQQQATAAAAEGPPIVLHYSMQQLMADVQHKLNLSQQQQQQRDDKNVKVQLAAASLQESAAATDGNGGGGLLAPDADSISTAAAAASDATAAAVAANDAATAELARVFDKADFAVMQPVGQFNLGFIIARLRGDLYIVDQHAADEKSTFERLMGDYTVNKQPLLHPRRLTTLTPVDEQVIREHIEVFRHNGFEFVDAKQQQQNRKQQAAAEAATAEGNLSAAVQQAAADTDLDSFDPNAHDAHNSDDHNSTCDLLLSSVPLVRGSGAAGVLGEEVLVELLDLIAAGDRRLEDLRPKRVRDMLASRACRTSIMIGSYLTKQQQKRILARLAELDAPWNCPHGRPTMRHLAVLPERGLEI